MQKILFFGLVLTIFLGALLPACKHELGPLPFAPVDPNDTTVVIPPDPVDTSGVPCSPDTVYFQNQILPMLVSNCAMSGCHNVQSHKDGVITTDYANIMKNIKAFSPSQSKIYKSVIDPDPGDRMPEPPAPPFTTEQKNLLKKWIEQGAKNNVCNESYGQCDTTKVTYTAFIQPLMAGKCQGCHGANNPGGGIKLTNYAEVKASAQTGKFYGSIAWSPGVSAMPQNGAKLSACQTSKVQAWINAGMPQ